MLFVFAEEEEEEEEEDDDDDDEWKGEDFEDAIARVVVLPIPYDERPRPMPMTLPLGEPANDDEEDEPRKRYEGAVPTLRAIALSWELTTLPFVVVTKPRASAPHVAASTRLHAPVHNLDVVLDIVFVVGAVAARISRGRAAVGAQRG